MKLQFWLIRLTLACIGLLLASSPKVPNIAKHTNAGSNPRRKISTYGVNYGVNITARKGVVDSALSRVYSAVQIFVAKTGDNV